ncbi:cytochrome c1 [Sarracenia purpurea var. burkii]
MESPRYFVYKFLFPTIVLRHNQPEVICRDKLQTKPAMALTSRPLLLIFILTLSVPFVISDFSTAIGGRNAASAGGWQPINNLKAPEVQETAQFAVKEHNKQANTKLKFQSVVRGETQVVSGTNYRLILAARDGTVSGDYEAIVWVKPWLRYRNLTSFKEV